MFEKQIRIFGKHSDIIKKYSKDKQGSDEQPFIVDDNEGNPVNIYIFETKLECFMCAAMLGIIEKKTAPQDSNREKYSTIFADIVLKNKDNLNRIYQHMILSENNGDSADATIKKAFSITNMNSDEDEARIESYARAGLEIIDEYFSSCNSYEDVVNSISSFLNKYGLR